MNTRLFDENFDIIGDPKVPPYTRREHELRYELVLPYVKDKTVLDIGCGYGYGAAMLAKAAKHVTAIDLMPTAIKWWQRSESEPNQRSVSAPLRVVV